jgi:hypothetical protein
MAKRLVSNTLQPHTEAEQVAQLKAHHKGALLLFHDGPIGSFPDREQAELVRSLGVPVRFPWTQLEQHMKTLLRAGHRIAICEPVK